jgi:hypothetical protein
LTLSLTPDPAKGQNPQQDSSLHVGSLPFVARKSDQEKGSNSSPCCFPLLTSIFNSKL